MLYFAHLRVIRSIFCLLTLTFLSLASEAQSYQILHSFTGGADGSFPYVGLTMDRAGNLYGTASQGGSGYGVVFKLAHNGSNWTFTPIYKFKGGTDGIEPASRLTIGPDGALYGTTATGGIAACTFQGYAGCGTVYRLTPPARPCTSVLCEWTKTTLYSFTGGDGANPQIGDLTFDSAGNLYGSTLFGGQQAAQCATTCGVIYQLTGSRGGWTEHVLHSFSGPDGSNPYSGVVLDSDGNLYGTTYIGGTQGLGTVFQLVPTQNGWVENVLHSFGDPFPDGVEPIGGLVFDSAGNLYGTTSAGALQGEQSGIVFELTPGTGGWTYSGLAGFEWPGTDQPGGPAAPLTFDAAGNLYGTTVVDNGTFGSIFRLSHSNGQWSQTTLHSFFGDGSFPWSNVVLDGNGHAYGTTHAGGQFDHGVVWEITL